MNEKSKIVTRFSLTLFILLIVYIPTFVWMWARWFAEESYYGHGILIPFISGYFIWQRRDLLKETKPSSNPALGISLVIVGLLMHILCAMLKVYFISGFSLLLVLWGLILYFFGAKMVKNLIFPLIFLLAMIPLPLVMISNLTVKLKIFAAHLATFTLNKVGFPSVLDGNIIRMPQSFTVVDSPCSGLRSLISLITLGLIFSYSLKVSYLKKGIILLSSIPIAIATNVMRIAAISIVNDLYGGDVAMGFFHDFTGFMVFFVAFLALFGIGRILEKGGKSDEK